MKTTIIRAISSDLPLLILGKSGWGKTSIVEQAGVTLGLEVFKLSLALCLPEDIGGVPQPSGNSFRYLLPDWFYSRADKPFILFFDEINQASPQTLHAIYSLVHERRLHSTTNKQMRVVAAGNMADENPHLTDIMAPLLNRFYVLDFVHNERDALDFLNSKYGLKLLELETSPRDTEQGIVAYRAGLKSLAIKKAGANTVKYLEGTRDSVADNLIGDLKLQKIADRNGFI